MRQTQGLGDVSEPTPAESADRRRSPQWRAGHRASQPRPASRPHRSRRVDRGGSPNHSREKPSAPIRKKVAQGRLLSRRRAYPPRRQPRRSDRQDPPGSAAHGRWTRRNRARMALLAGGVLALNTSRKGQRIGLATVVSQSAHCPPTRATPATDNSTVVLKTGGLAVTDCRSTPTRVRSGVASARAPVPGTGLPVVDCWVRGNSRRPPTSRGGSGGNRAGSAPQPCRL